MPLLARSPRRRLPIKRVFLKPNSDTWRPVPPLLFLAVLWPLAYYVGYLIH